MERRRLSPECPCHLRYPSWFRYYCCGDLHRPVHVGVPDSLHDTPQENAPKRRVQRGRALGIGRHDYHRDWAQFHRDHWRKQEGMVHLTGWEHAQITCGSIHTPLPSLSVSLSLYCVSLHFPLSSPVPLSPPVREQCPASVFSKSAPVYCMHDRANGVGQNEIRRGSHDREALLIQCSWGKYGPEY